MKFGEIGEGEDSFPRNRMLAVESGGLTSEDIRSIPQALSQPLDSVDTATSQEKFSKSGLSSHYGDSTTPPELARVRAYRKGSQGQSSGQSLPPRRRIGQSNLPSSLLPPPRNFEEGHSLHHSAVSFSAMTKA